MTLLLSNLLSTFSILATVLYCIGIIFLIVEAFIPGFGFFGISGIAMLVVSIITKVLVGESLNTILWGIVIAFLVIIALLIWIIISAKKGLISKSPLISSGSSIPTFYSDDDLNVHIEKEGVTVTTCKPVGKIRLDDEIFEAQSLDGLLDIGTKIKVVAVNNNMLEICKVKEIENEN